MFVPNNKPFDFCKAPDHGQCFPLSCRVTGLSVQKMEKKKHHNSFTFLVMSIPFGVSWDVLQLEKDAFNALFARIDAQVGLTLQVRPCYGVLYYGRFDHLKQLLLAISSLPWLSHSLLPRHQLFWLFSCCFYVLGAFLALS